MLKTKSYPFSNVSRMSSTSSLCYDFARNKIRELQQLLRGNHHLLKFLINSSDVIIYWLDFLAVHFGTTIFCIKNKKWKCNRYNKRNKAIKHTIYTWTLEKIFSLSLLPLFKPLRIFKSCGVSLQEP